MGKLQTINFMGWINEHRHLLKPPVGNQQIWADREFMVTIVGGPNARTDYHVNEGEEFFYQVEGDIVLKLIDDGEWVDLPIRQGEIFLLPPKIPHSPQRPAGTVGLVLERRRGPGERDGFVWFCPSCRSKMYEEFLEVKDLVKDLPPVFEHFYGDAEHCTCRSCGFKATKPNA
jgi:3-hydroxyanthranilate 3,4-dioxygenase